MTNDATTANVDQDAAESPAESVRSDYAEQVRSFQLMFVGELHRLVGGFESGPVCSTFDQVMNDIGLPARPEVTPEGKYGYTYKGVDILEDIDNEDDARRWALKVAKGLTEATDSYGYRSVYDPRDQRYVYLNELLEFFGFPTRQPITMKVTGTFDVELTKDGWEDANLIDNVDRYDVASAIANAVHSGAKSVQWKVQSAESK